jgi:hypothetical protein
MFFLFVQVSLCHMGCRVGNKVGDVEEVTFLYRLTPGECPKSYGVNVAWLAGKTVFSAITSFFLDLCSRTRRIAAKM